MPIPEEKLKLARLLRIGETAPFNPDQLFITALDQLEYRAWCNGLALSEKIRIRLATRTPEEDWKARNSNWKNNPFTRGRTQCATVEDE